MVLKLSSCAPLRFRDIFAVLTPAVAGSCAMLGSVALASIAMARESPPLPAYTRLAVQVFAGAAVYMLVLVFPFRTRVLRYVRFLRSLRRDPIDGPVLGLENPEF